MGNRKSEILAKIKEGTEIGDEAKISGAEINGEGTQVKQLLDSMNRDIDEDDIRVIDLAESSYKEDFDAAFTNEVDTKVTDSIQIEKEAGETADTEQSKVEEIHVQFEQLKDTSDIGGGNAERGKMSMEQSAKDYEAFGKQANEVEQNINEAISKLRSQLEEIF